MKKYVTVSECVWNHILEHKKLSAIDKIVWLYLDIQYQINRNIKEKRACDLSARFIAGRLKLSKSSIFSGQKTLEEVHYLTIYRTKNYKAQYNTNIIIPQIPSDVFYFLNKNSKNRHNAELHFKEMESELEYLHRVKFSHRLSTDYLTYVLTSDLNPTQKVLLIYLYLRSVGSNKDKSDNKVIVISINELSHIFNKDVSHINRSLKKICDTGLINREHFYKKSDDKLGARKDKSLWKISIGGNVDNKKHDNVNYALYDRPSAKCDHHIKITNFKKEYKYRSILENDNCGKVDINNSRVNHQQNTQPTIKSSPNKQDFTVKKKNIFEYLPLKDAVIKSISTSVGLDAAKVIDCIRDIATRFPDLGFYSYKHFIAYMIQALRNNMLRSKASSIDDITLDDETIEELNKRSGRKFNKNTATFVLDRIRTKKPDIIFKTKESYLNYMAKAFKYQKYCEHYFAKSKDQSTKYITELRDAFLRSYSDIVKKEMTYITDARNAWYLARNISFDESVCDGIYTVEAKKEVSAEQKQIILEAAQRVFGYVYDVEVVNV